MNLILAQLNPSAGNIEQNKKRAIEKLMPDVIHQIAKNKDDERKCTYHNVKQYNSFFKFF